ncbi:hypothetical protein ACN27F_10735 [Solwaraspora sp. WMMB335]|uniref:hypothetical protein n=1 Tax=Solwaraspora sp. WMMB335 TaxID=3404118 RepID=UPI003B943B17
MIAGLDDPRGHFISRAQGYQGRVYGADRFRGRREAVEAVRDWLRRDLPPGRPLVVTGQPGAGKSAVLARVVLELEQNSPVAGVAVHARGATCDKVAEGVAQAAGITGTVSVSKLYEILKDDRGVPPRLVVAVDALDEALDGEIRRIALLLADLARLPRLRVVVATRPLSAGDRYRPGGLLPALGVPGPDGENLVDLDTPSYLDPDGLRQFILAILTGDGVEPPSPYRDQPQVAGRLAKVIATRASSNHQQPGSSYLVAALAAAALTDRKQVVNPALPGFDPTVIPSTVGEAITKYLDRLADPKAAVAARGLLTALAYAEGGGLDHDRWVTFATVLGYPATGADLDALRGSAAADYLLQTVASDYDLITRLFHQALTDELLRDRDGLRRRDQTAITTTLLPTTARYWLYIAATVPPAALHRPAAPRGWTCIDDYTRLHLPSHAAAARLLDDLMTDPGFLLACPPMRILQHSRTLTSREAITAAAALDAATTRDWEGWNTDRQAWWLHVWARKTRATALADALITDHPAWPWHVHTAIWADITYHRTNTGAITESWVPRTRTAPHTSTGHTDAVVAVAAWTGPDGRTRIVTGSHDRTVRVWDADSGTQLAELTGHSSVVVAVAGWTGPDGRIRIVTGSWDRTVRVWDADSGTRLAELTGHTDAVVAVAAWSGPDGRIRIASGSHDDTVRVWDPDSGTRPAELTGHTDAVVAVAAWSGPDGRTRIVTGSWDRTVRVWDADSGTRLAELTGHTDAVVAVAAWSGPDGRIRIASGSHDDTVRVWDPDSGTRPAELTSHNSVVVAVAGWTGPDGRTRIVTGSWDRTVRVWDPDSGTQLAELTGHTDWVVAVAVWTGPDGRTRIVTGSHDRTVMVWATASHM